MYIKTHCFIFTATYNIPVKVHCRPRTRIVHYMGHRKHTHNTKLTVSASKFTSANT